MNYQLNKLYEVTPTKNNNAIIFSKLSGLEFAPRSAPATGLKFVLDGREDYTVGKHYLPVSTGQFLVVNAYQDFSAVIARDQVATGLCVNISCEIISEVFNVITDKVEKNLDNALCPPARIINFSESIRSVEGSGFVSSLDVLTRKLNNNNLVIPTEEMFYELAFQLLKGEQSIKESLCGIETKKQSTKDELHRRVKIAKAVLDSTIFHDINLEQLATEASLSKFHLLRIFKKAYGISPYQYQLKRKLDFAAVLLKMTRKSVDEIAFFLNYTDQQSFNKLFKKHFGLTPGKFRTSLTK